MAYKFQLGQARLSGSVIQEGDVQALASEMSASTIALGDASGIAGAGMENQNGNLGIADNGIVNSMLSGGISSDKIAELNAFDSGDLAEGSNLYYTEARWDSKMAAADTDDLAEGVGNLYWTVARGESMFDSKLAAADTDDLSEGVSNLYWTVARGETMFDNKLAAADTGDLAEGSNLYFTEARVHAAVSVADSNSIDMSYDGNGQFSADAIVDDSSIEIDAAVGLRVKALGITNSMLSGAIASSKIAELNAFSTSDLAEGSNLYWTVARGESMFDSKLAAADTDDLAEGASNLYYTDARARAALSVADSNSIDMSYGSGTGQFSADVLVDPAALEVTVDGVSLKSSISGSRTFQHDLTVQGSLYVEGDLTYVNTTNLSISDALITVGSGSSAFANSYGIEFGDVDGGWASMKTAEVATGVNGFEFSHPIKASRFYGEVVGSFVESIQTLTATATIDQDNGTQILLDHATEQTFTLPAAADIEGMVLKIKRIGSGNSVIVPAGSEELEGGASITLESQGAAVSIISDGSNYYVI